MPAVSLLVSVPFWGRKLSTRNEQWKIETGVCQTTDSIQSDNCCGQGTSAGQNNPGGCIDSAPVSKDRLAYVPDHFRRRMGWVLPYSCAGGDVGRFWRTSDRLILRRYSTSSWLPGLDDLH